MNEERTVKVIDKTDLVDQLDYYERLLDFLNDMIPCLDELVEQFNEEEI